MTILTRLGRSGHDVFTARVNDSLWIRIRADFLDVFLWSFDGGGFGRHLLALALVGARISMWDVGKTRSWEGDFGLEIHDVGKSKIRLTGV